MAATARPLLPFDVWPPTITQAATPANDNAMRAEVLAAGVLSIAAAEPGSPADNDLHIIGTVWAAYPDEVVGTLAYFVSGTWYFWEPFEGLVKNVAGTLYEYTSGAWAALTLPAGAVLVPIAIACSDETTALTTGAAKVTFRLPYAMTLTDVRASVTTAPTGAALQVDISVTGTGSILSTPITIDAGEKTSTTATTPPVIGDTTLDDDAEVTIDIDQIGSTIAGAGLKVWLIGYKTP